MLNKIFLIGPCGGGKIPQNGASAKNYHLLKYLKGKKGLNLSVIDTEKWRKNPLIIIRLFLSILFFRKGKFILSADSMSSYRLIQLLNWLPKRDLIYWVIGGSVADWIREGKVRTKPYRIVNWFLVEGNKMKVVLNECGFSNNVIVVPNFKNIDYIPQREKHREGLVNFVFLSRIIPEKGCDVIFNAVDKLNLDYQDKFSVTFYGPIEKSYSDAFNTHISRLENVFYKGFLDLRLSSNYDVLANYDVMLFPTFWRGEGFPGVVIDAFVAGLPVIASDWNLNRDILEEEVTGLIIPPKDSVALAEVMKTILINPSQIEGMSIKCQAVANDYKIDQVLNDDLFRKIGIVE